MKIDAPAGTKVVYSHPENGHSYDQEHSAKFLKPGQSYTVLKTDIGNWHTDVYLKEFPSKAFNSVQFTEVPAE